MRLGEVRHGQKPVGERLDPLEQRHLHPEGAASDDVAGDEGVWPGRVWRGWAHTEPGLESRGLLGHPRKRSLKRTLPGAWEAGTSPEPYS